MIDIHMHIGKLYFDKTLTPSYVLKFMDRNGIEKAILLPIENPEATFYYVTTDYVLDVCKRHPDRFIPFCNVDPRRGFGYTGAHNRNDFYRIIKEYKEKGCRGLGEVLAGMRVDDPALQTIYEVCGKLKMPIIFDLCSLTCIDGKGLPGFEKMIRKFPETVFIGHGPHFWSEISGDVEEKDLGGYPAGPVTKEGAVVKLLSAYNNCYADLSAGSGFNAITRDPEFGIAFLERFRDKLLFGTDLCRFGQKVDNASLLKRLLSEKRLSEKTYRKITKGNAIKLLALNR